MRKVVVFMHTTVDNRIANGDGLFWEPFPWGDEEMNYNNELFRTADTWVFGRVAYEAVVPWWDAVARGDVPADAGRLTAADREFAALQKGLSKVVFSRTLDPAPGRTVIAGDVAARLLDLKHQEGRDIFLTCGPETLAPLAAAPGVIDQYVLVVHPAVLSAGPRLFGASITDLALRLVDSKTFAGGCAVLRYETR